MSLPLTHIHRLLLFRVVAVILHTKNEIIKYYLWQIHLILCVLFFHSFEKSRTVDWYEPTTTTNTNKIFQYQIKLRKEFKQGNNVIQRASDRIY